MIDSIRDDATREQAKVNRILVVMQTDPRAAREMPDDPDISDLQKRRIASQIERCIARGY